MGKNIQGPPCQACGKPLRPRRADKCNLTREEAYELKKLMNPALRPSVRKPLFNAEGAHWVVSYQVGWGMYDAFCGGGCAQLWASQRVKRYRFDPREISQ